MGRTLRRRHFKKKQYSVESENEAVNLEHLSAWMRSENWSPTCDLLCYDFPGTGRGLKALQRVENNTTIMRIPKKLLITTSNITQSDIQQILLNANISDAQSVLAGFLVYELHLGHQSRWKPYLDSLPKFFSNPYFCIKSEKQQLPSYVSDFLNVQSIQIKRTYLTLITAIDDVGNKKECGHCGLAYKKIMKFSKYLWAYFVVNTRAIYIDNDESGRKFKSNNLALAPFLDLFNHSFTASVKTGLVKKQSQEEFYEITTLKSFNQGSQIFINYGAHDNTKLYVEYGFYIPNNPLDEILFDISDINSCVSLSEVQCDFLKTHGFDKRMGFNTTGLNYNGKVSVFVAGTKLAKKYWLLKIYGGNLNDGELTEVHLLGKKILEIKKNMLIDNLKKMKELTKKGTYSFEIAVNLVEEHIRVLESSLRNMEK